MTKYYHLSDTPPLRYPLREFPVALKTLYLELDWPAAIDWLLPENVKDQFGVTWPYCRCPTDWIMHWYGSGNAKSDIAQMVLREILGYNAYQYWYKGWGLIGWWQANGGDSIENKTRALNEMNYRLGYRHFFHVPIDPDWTGEPWT